MAGIDVLVCEALNTDRVRSALAEVFGTSVDRIVMIEDVTQYPSCGCAAVCQFFHRTEGIPLHLSLDWFGPLSPADVVTGLAEHLEAECVVGRNGSNPYLFDVVSPDGSRRSVEMEAAAMNERDVYLLRDPSNA